MIPRPNKLTVLSASAGACSDTRDSCDCFLNSAPDPLHAKRYLGCNRKEKRSDLPVPWIFS